MVYLGLFPTAIAFATWAYALNRMSAGRLGSTTYLVPPIVIVMSLLILNEVPPLLSIAGGVPVCPRGDRRAVARIASVAAGCRGRGLKPPCRLRRWDRPRCHPRVSARDEELVVIHAFLDRPEGSMTWSWRARQVSGSPRCGSPASTPPGSRGFRVLDRAPPGRAGPRARGGRRPVWRRRQRRAAGAAAARRRALELALLIGEAPEDPIDPRTLGVAIHSTLEFLAREGPLLLAIDDVQWVDSSSAEAIGFALRRLGGTGSGSCWRGA